MCSDSLTPLPFLREFAGSLASYTGPVRLRLEEVLLAAVSGLGRRAAELIKELGREAWAKEERFGSPKKKEPQGRLTSPLKIIRTLFRLSSTESANAPVGRIGASRYAAFRGLRGRGQHQSLANPERSSGRSGTSLWAGTRSDDVCQSGDLCGRSVETMGSSWTTVAGKCCDFPTPLNHGAINHDHCVLLLCAIGLA